MAKATRKEQDQQHKKGLKPLNEYVKYSGLAFQMGILMYLGFWGGQKLDNDEEGSFPIFTVLFTFLALGLSFYSLFKSLPKN